MHHPGAYPLGGDLPRRLLAKKSRRQAFEKQVSSVPECTKTRFFEPKNRAPFPDHSRWGGDTPSIRLFDLGAYGALAQGVSIRPLSTPFGSAPGVTPPNCVVKAGVIAEKWLFVFNAKRSSRSPSSVVKNCKIFMCHWGSEQGRASPCQTSLRYISKDCGEKKRFLNF